MKAELLRRALAGVEPPEIDGQVARDRDYGFLALRAGGAGAFAQECQPLPHRWIGGLEADQSPRQLDERSSQSRVAMLGHAALDPFVAAAVLAGTKAGVTRDLSPVLEALPVADFA